MQQNVIGKDKFVTYGLCIFLGWTGLHHFYLRRFLFGVIYLFTFGLFGVGWIFDIYRIRSLLHDCENKQEGILRHDDMRLLTSLLGFTGIQHFILKRYRCGVFFLLTLGGLGFGWIVDIFRINHLTEGYNMQSFQRIRQPKYLLADAYIYCFPLGFLGLHHFYLSRPKWGIFYFLTLGNFGIGWIIDMVRMRWLIEQAHDRSKWDIIDAYILWFPLGIFGAHWVYLGRPIRAVTYTLTLGYMLVGWLIDIKRIPAHINSLNRRYMLAGIMHAEDADSLQWDDSDFSSSLLPDTGILSINKHATKHSKKTKVHLSTITARAICLECGRPGLCVMPCTHFSLCYECVQMRENCPRCDVRITGWATVDL